MDYELPSSRRHDLLCVPLQIHDQRMIVQNRGIHSYGDRILNPKLLELILLLDDDIYILNVSKK